MVLVRKNERNLGHFSQLVNIVDRKFWDFYIARPCKTVLKKQILKALLTALRPIAKMLLRNGVGFREFNEISKSAFVDVATKDYGLRGRPTNISRVAVMTGLTRKEVRRIRDKIDSGEEAVVARSTPLGAVLSSWYTDADFLDSVGTPRDLPFDGGTPSFNHLVKRAGGDIPPGAMRTELKRIGAVEETETGLLRPVKRYAVAAGADEMLVTGLIRGMRPLGATIAHNTNPVQPSEPWVQRTVSTKSVRREDLSRLRRISHDRLEEFTEAIDDLYSAYETLHSSDKDKLTAKAGTIGVGVFYFEDLETNSS